MEQHFKIVAVLQIVMGVLSLSIALLVFGILAGAGVLASILSDNRMALLVTGTVGLFVAVILAVLALPSVIAGIGLMRRREWARILTIVLSFFHLLHMPLGTIVGAYSLWALLQPQASTHFR